MSFRKIQRRPTLAEEVCSQIKESILGGEYPAGEALPTEPELAEQVSAVRWCVMLCECFPLRAC